MPAAALGMEDARRLDAQGVGPRQATEVAKASVWGPERTARAVGATETCSHNGVKAELEPSKGCGAGRSEAKGLVRPGNQAPELPELRPCRW